MLELVKEHDFAICALCISRVLECIEYFFKSECLTGFFVFYFPYVTIGTATYFFKELIIVEDMILNLICHWMMSYGMELCFCRVNSVYFYKFRSYNLNSQSSVLNIFVLIRRLNKIRRK